MSKRKGSSKHWKKPHRRSRNKKPSDNDHKGNNEEPLTTSLRESVTTATWKQCSGRGWREWKKAEPRCSMGKVLQVKRQAEMVCKRMQILMDQLECLTSEEDKMDWEPTEMSA